MGTRKIVVSPFQYNSYVFDHYELFFNLVRDELGFEIVCKSKVTKADVEGADLVIVHKYPSFNFHTTFVNLPDILDKDAKLIGYYSDIHTHGAKSDPEYKKNRAKVFNRCSTVMCPYRGAFQKLIPEFKDKLEWFPHFIPDRFIDRPFVEKPTNRALLIGCTAGYPLRGYVERGRFPEVDIQKHPGYGTIKGMKPEAVVRERYRDMIASHITTITDGSKFHGPIAKYFEIPATSSLLLAKPLGELGDLGFKAGHNYIAAEQRDIHMKIKDIVAHPGNFTQVRKAGQELVNSRHTIYHRLKKFRTIIGDIMGIEEVVRSVRGVRGILSSPDMRNIIEYALESTGPKIEIGALCGFSSCCISNASQAGDLIVSIDAWDTANLSEKAKEILRQVSGHAALRQRDFKPSWDKQVKRSARNPCTPIKGKSLEVVDKVKELLNGQQAGFMFIDGAHDYDTVKGEIEQYLPLVKTGGYIVFHDYVPKWGLYKAVNEAIAAGLLEVVKKDYTLVTRKV